MNKYLMLSAAALMASGMATNPASADTIRLGLDGYCDGFQIVPVIGHMVYGTKHLYTGCSFTGSAPAASGISGKNKKLGRMFGFKDYIYTESYDANADELIGYAFQLPIQSGNKWCAFSALGFFFCGTYYTGYAPAKAGKEFLRASARSAKAPAKSTFPRQRSN